MSQLQYFFIISHKMHPQSLESTTPFLSVDWWYLQADFVFDRFEKPEKIIQKIEQINSPQSEQLIKIFVKTDLLPTMYDTLFQITKPFILITASNDDHSAPYMNYPSEESEIETKSDLLLKHQPLLKWFAKNTAIKHPKMQPFLLGPKWQWKTIQFFGEDKSNHMRIYNELCLTPKERMIDQESKPNLLYFNFANTTNNPFYKSTKGLRHRIKMELMKRFPYCPQEPFEQYMHTLGTYKFCVAPPGRGIDTHRIAEALMQGTIVIVSHIPSLVELYQQLPVIILNDDEWSLVTPEFLEGKYRRMMARIDLYKFEKLYCDFWKNKLERCNI